MVTKDFNASLWTHAHERNVLSSLSFRKIIVNLSEVGASGGRIGMVFNFRCYFIISFGNF